MCVHREFKSLHMPPYTPIPPALTILRWSSVDPCDLDIKIPLFHQASEEPLNTSTHFRLYCKLSRMLLIIIIIIAI